MPISRIYQPIELSVNTTLRLSENASHHLARVLRASVNDEIILFNGKGGEFTAVIKKIEKKFIEVEINAFSDRDAESPIKIHLGQGIARGEKMDFIIQKAVELGVSTITPLMTERCNVRLDQAREEKRLQHWQGVIESACEQSGRNRIPTLSATQSLADWIKTTSADLCFTLSPHATAKLSAVDASAAKNVAILIGPEGGLSPQEIQLATQSHFKSLNLGPRVLRTETAALAALSILQSHFGDMV